MKLWMHTVSIVRKERKKILAYLACTQRRMWRNMPTVIRSSSDLFIEKLARRIRESEKKSKSALVVVTTDVVCWNAPPRYVLKVD